MRKVAITGIGVVSPCGIGKEVFWKNSITGRSFTERYTDFPDYSLKSRVVGKIKEFKPEYTGYSKEDNKRLGLHTQYALCATKEAIADSKLVLSELEKEHAGVCIANAIADTPFSEKQFLELNGSLIKSVKNNEEDVKPDPNLFYKAMFNCISTEIASAYGLLGSAFTMSTGCTGGIDAVGYGWETIREGSADVMICGASEAPLTCMTVASFDVIGAISSRKCPPDQASRPFDEKRDGFVLAEGSGILILEELEHAKRRGAKIYAEVVSFGTKNNAWHMTNLPDDGDPLAKTLELLFSEGDVQKKDVSYINAHGSSTPQNDVFETEAYKRVFGERVYSIPVSSSKTIWGHPLAAASAIELVHCCCAMENNIAPPTVNLQKPDMSCDLDYVPLKPRSVPMNVIVRTASGFSGIHSALILRRVNEA